MLICGLMARIWGPRGTEVEQQGADQETPFIEVSNKKSKNQLKRADGNFKNSTFRGQ